MRDTEAEVHERHSINERHRQKCMRHSASERHRQKCMRHSANERHRGKSADLYSLPGPVPVLLLLGETPQVEMGLQHLRPQDVILLIRPCGFRFRAAIKSECFWPKFYS